ncbi:uncharacterized protein LOC114882599 [Osmia bicornis bicornis]|uniref:uncharacterized protein LOC114882599 n=1 Tax=Osmia bicornis bicornis TaxID=1437191 RepID=UPI001EAEAFC7|nr:uncharacterized protein LOC114882599 [Osmia bicornis bicornis]
MPDNSASSSHAQTATRGSNIGTLRRRRGHILGQISSLKTFLDYYEESDSRDSFLLETHLNGLNETWKKFDDLQFALEELDESEEPRRYQIQNDYYTAIARANRLLHNGQPTGSTTRAANPSPASTASAPMAIKLPEMRLPTFDGTIEEWSSFHDIFTLMIDRNEDLTPVQKFQYLRSTLTGKAAACIKALSTTDANYHDAIELLREKYDCPRRVILGHCDALRDIPKLIRDTPEALGDLVDNVNQHLRALTSLGENVISWNSLLLSMILSKLNSNTVWHWELALKDKRTVPAYTDLLAFLEKRANCARTSITRAAPTAEPRGSGPSGNPRVMKHRPSRGHAFLSTKTRQHPYEDHRTNDRQHMSAPPRRCPVCDKNHIIWFCERFHGSSVRDRIAAVNRASLCHNCLRDGHNADACKHGTCRICRKKHHTLLHQTITTAEPTPRRASESSQSTETTRQPR